jgi:tripartite-type tricarboxylate transporter receptor subunit TctC
LSQTFNTAAVDPDAMARMKVHPPPARDLRRRTVACALAAGFIPSIRARTATATYPARPVRLIVPFAPGGPTDMAARMVAEELAGLLGQAIVVDNRPGAGGNIGAEAAARALPDGYTLFWAQAATHGINPTLYPQLGYDALSDFAPVATLVSEPLVIVAHPALPADDVAGLIALAKARAGRLTFGSGGHGSTPHMAGQLFAWLSQTSLTHVPYKGNAPAVADVMARHIDIVFDGVNAAAGHLRSGKLKALGVTSRERSALLPEVATVGASLPGYDVTSWGGIVVPAATPAAVVTRLSEALQQIGDRADTRRRFAQLGMRFEASSPKAMGDFVREQIERWRPLVRATGSHPQ